MLNPRGGGSAVPPPGGLYLAHHSPFDDAAVVSTTASRAGIAGSRCPARCRRSTRPACDTGSLPLALSLAQREASRLSRERQAASGDPLHHRRNLQVHLWTRNGRRTAEDFSARPSSVNALEALETLVDRRTQFGRSLRSQVRRQRERSRCGRPFRCCSSAARHIGLIPTYVTSHWAWLKRRGRSSGARRGRHLFG